jgi:GntR family transcriptional regulator
MVASGQLAPGAELPSVRELAIQHAVNPMTVSKAYSLLEAEGLLERNRGRPMTVANRPRNASPLSRRLQQIQPLVEQTVLAAKQLELSEADLLKAVRENWENDDV